MKSYKTLMPLRFKNCLRDSLWSKSLLILRFELSQHDPNIEYYEDPDADSKKYYMN